MVGIVQISSGIDPEINFQKIKMMVEECAVRGASLVCLPENFHYMGRNQEDDVKVAESIHSHKTIKRYRQLALEN